MNVLKFAPTVLCPRSVIIVAAVHNARVRCGFEGDTLVTSMNDSLHMQGSKHYTDEAADFRTRDLTQTQVNEWAVMCRTRLGKGYQVIIEKNHLHVETAG